MLPLAERGSLLERAHGLLLKCCFFDLGVVPGVSTSSLVYALLFCLANSSARMKEITIRTGKQDSVSRSAVRSSVWSGVGLVYGEENESIP